MSLINLAVKNGRVILVIGLEKSDIDHILADDVVYLEAKEGFSLPDIALFAGDTEADLIAALGEMAKDND